MRKPLSEMTRKELWRLFPIELRDYDERYPRWFAQEAAALALVFAGSLSRISHVGSTAVPGLLSKPIVDLLLEAGQVCADEVVERLGGAGWLLMAAAQTPFRIDLNKGYTPAGFAQKVFHLHVVRPGDHDELYFRDSLRAHPRVAEEYAELKRGLLANFEFDRDGYTEAKTSFVRRATAAARAEFPGRYAGSAGKRPL